jgi:hypothetical protein
MMKIKGHTLFLRNKKNQSLESQTFLKIPFLATPRIVSAMVSGAFEHPNSQFRAGARRSQEIPQGSPHSCVGIGGLVVGTKSKILISWFGFYSRLRKNTRIFFSNHLNQPRMNA